MEKSKSISKERATPEIVSSNSKEVRPVYQLGFFAALGVHTMDGRITREVLNKGVELENESRFVKGLRNLGNT